MLNDPRIKWDSHEPALDQCEHDLARNLLVATDLGDEASIKLATRELTELRTCRADLSKARAPLDEAIAEGSAAEAETEHAGRVDAAGAPDAKSSLRNHEAVIVAASKARYYGAKVPGLVATCDGLRERVSRAAYTSISRDVIAETKGLIDKIFAYENLDSVLATADDLGRRSKADRAAYWPIACELARREFVERLPAVKAERAPRDAEGRFIDWRTEDRFCPGLGDLESVFQRRAGAFESERRRLAAQLAALTGEAEALGGAA